MTEDELVRDMQEAMQAAEDPDGFVTTKELANRMGCGADKVRKYLQVLHTADRLEVRKVKKISISGAQGFSPAYRIKPKGD